MRQFAKRGAVPAALALVLFGCAQQATEGAQLAAGEKLQITQDVWNEYQDYVKQGRGLGPDRQGAFGIAIVGDVGVAGLSTYRYCIGTYDDQGRLIAIEKRFGTEQIFRFEYGYHAGGKIYEVRR